MRMSKLTIPSSDVTTLKTSFTPSPLGMKAFGTNNNVSQFLSKTESLALHPIESVTVTL
jgi:hypothetical protein